MTSYTNSLTAEQLIGLISNDYIELSHDKIKNQRNFFMKICGDWLQYQERLKELDPDSREWTYDGCGNLVHKEDYTKQFTKSEP